MNRTMREACEKLRFLLSRSPRDDVMARYQAGAIVAEVKRSRARYGAHAVGQLARWLGQREQTLYRYSVVAERWTPGQVEALLTRRTRDGQPLSWSHLVLLAEVDSESERDRWIDRALSGPLSVRDLASLMADPSEDRVLHHRVPVAIFRRLQQRIDGCAQELDAVSAELWSELDGAASAQSAPDVQAMLDWAIRFHQRMSAAALKQAEQLILRRSLLLRDENGPAIPRLL